MASPDVLEKGAEAVKGPLSMVLPDGLEVVFPENVSPGEGLLSNKEISRFKEFSSFLGMPIEGCDKEICWVLSKLWKKASSRTPCKGRKKKSVPVSRSERELKRLDCSINYGDSALASKRSGINYWELISVD